MPMTEEEARNLLPQYADGMLVDQVAGEVEVCVKHSPTLQEELRELRAQNQLLIEALAPLKPSRSARMRLSDMMADYHRRATEVARTMPERGWRIFRLCFVFLSLMTATLLIHFYPPLASNFEDGLLLPYINGGIFALSMAFVIFGRSLGSLESFIVRRLRDRFVEPAALEILIIEVFGIMGTLSAFAMYILMLSH